MPELVGLVKGTWHHEGLLSGLEGIEISLSLGNTRTQQYSVRYALGISHSVLVADAPWVGQEWQ